MTQLGIARVINTKGEPAKPAIPIAQSATEANRGKNTNRRGIIKTQKNNRTAADVSGRGITINIHNHSNPVPTVIGPSEIKPRRKRIQRVVAPKAIYSRAEFAAPKMIAKPGPSIKKPAVKSVAKPGLSIKKPAVKSIAKPISITHKPTLKKAVRQTAATPKPSVKPVGVKRKEKTRTKVAKGVLKVITSPIRLPFKGMQRVFKASKKR